MINPFYKAMIVTIFDDEDVDAIKNIFSEEHSLKQAQAYIRNEFRNLVLGFKLKDVSVNLWGQVSFVGEVGKIFSYINEAPDKIKECEVSVSFETGKRIRLNIQLICSTSGEIRQKRVKFI